MKRKLLITGATLFMIASTGIAAVALHNSENSPKPSKSAVVSVTTDKQGNEVTITSEETAVVESVSDNLVVEDSSTSVSAVGDVVTVEASRLETAQATINAQAAAIAPYFAGQVSVDNFIAIQWRCLSRGFSENSSDEQFGYATSFLAPQPTDDGRSLYRFFDGGCRVIEMMH